MMWVLKSESFTARPECLTSKEIDTCKLLAFGQHSLILTETDSGKFINKITMTLQDTYMTLPTCVAFVCAWNYTLMDQMFSV